MSGTQTNTIQVRLPRGPHETVLDAQGTFYGQVERALHAANLAHAKDTSFQDFAHIMAGFVPAETLEDVESFKTKFSKKWGLTSRQFNALDRALAGRYASIKECAKLNIDTLHSKIADVKKAISPIQKKLDRDVSARRDIAVRTAVGKKPTQALLKKVMTKSAWESAKAALRAKTLRLNTLNTRLTKVKAVLKRPVPSVIFGGRDLFKARQKIHPNDAAGLAACRVRWDAARSGNFTLIGSKDEASGNLTCQARLAGEGLALHITLPKHMDTLSFAPGLMLGGHFVLPLPAQSRELKLIRSVLDAPEGTSIAYRFVRDADWSAKRTGSPWRVMITLKVPVAGEVVRRRLRGPVLGVDVNPDSLAWALTNANGNPISHGSIPLGLSGLTTRQRREVISLACDQVIKIASAAEASLAIETLDFSKKKKEISKDKKNFGRKGYARMLSSFSYAQILTDLTRKAERAGLSVRSVNPAYTSVIGAVNYAHRYGLSRHVASAVAIARRGQGFSERLNYVHGIRGSRTQRPAPEDAGRSVWGRWAQLSRETVRTVTFAGLSSLTPAPLYAVSTLGDAAIIHNAAQAATHFNVSLRPRHPLCPRCDHV